MVCFAVHLSDGVIQPEWWIGGWAVLGLILYWASRRLRDEEISSIGALTGAIFVASQLHLPLGGISVHLLLNGLAGMILPRRAPIAISVGLLMQALLFGHGGLTTLGLNAVIYSLPAIVAGELGREWARKPWLKSPWVQTLSMVLAAETLAVCVLLFAQITEESYHVGRLSIPNSMAQVWLWYYWAISVYILVAIGTCVLRWLWQPSAFFSLGMLIGGGTAFVTVMLSVTVLGVGGIDAVQPLVGVVLMAHLPVIFLEAIVVGFAFAYLKRVKPEWL